MKHFPFRLLFISLFAVVFSGCSNLLDQNNSFNDNGTPVLHLTLNAAQPRSVIPVLPDSYTYAVQVVSSTDVELGKAWKLKNDLGSDSKMDIAINNPSAGMKVNVLATTETVADGFTFGDFKNGAFMCGTAEVSSSGTSYAASVTMERNSESTGCGSLEFTITYPSVNSKNKALSKSVQVSCADYGGSAVSVSQQVTVNSTDSSKYDCLLTASSLSAGRYFLTYTIYSCVKDADGNESDKKAEFTSTVPFVIWQNMTTSRYVGADGNASTLELTSVQCSSSNTDLASYSVTGCDENVTSLENYVEGQSNNAKLVWLENSNTYYTTDFTNAIVKMQLSNGGQRVFIKQECYGLSGTNEYTYTCSFDEAELGRLSVATDTADSYTVAKIVQLPAGRNVFSINVIAADGTNQEGGIRFVVYSNYFYVSDSTDTLTESESGYTTGDGFYGRSCSGLKLHPFGNLQMAFDNIEYVMRITKSDDQEACPENFGVRVLSDMTTSPNANGTNFLEYKKNSGNGNSESGSSDSGTSAIPKVTLTGYDISSGASVQRAINAAADSSKSYRVINMSYGDLTLENIKVTGGKQAGIGAGVCIDGGVLTLKEGACVTGNTLVNNSEYQAMGGGVYIKAGGGLVIDGGAVDGNTVTFNLTSVDSNSYTAAGGGIYVSKNGSLEIKNGGSVSSNVMSCDTTSTCDKNMNGAGIYNEGTVLFTKGHIDGNQINLKTKNAGKGGGVYNKGTFTVSKETDTSDSDITISNNSVNISTTISTGGYAQGGGLFLDSDSGSGIFNFNAGVISGNTVSASLSTNEKGDGILNWSGTFNVQGTATVASDNQVYCDYNSGYNPITLTGSYTGTMTLYPGDYKTGEVMVNGNTTYVECYCTNFSVPSYKVVLVTITYSIEKDGTLKQGETSGGADKTYYIYDCATWVTAASEISGFTSGNYLVYIGNESETQPVSTGVSIAQTTQSMKINTGVTVLISSYSTTTCAELDFWEASHDFIPFDVEGELDITGTVSLPIVISTNNKDNGHKEYINNSGTVILTYTDFKFHTAAIPENGYVYDVVDIVDSTTGMIKNVSGTLEASDCNFTGNGLLTDRGYYYRRQSHAIYVTGGRMTFENCSFCDFHSNKGSGICVVDEDDSVCSVTLNNCTFGKDGTDYNVADEYGGNIYFKGGSNGTLTVNGGNISYGISSYGGNIFIGSCANAIFKDCIIENGTADYVTVANKICEQPGITSDENYGSGGGIYIAPNASVTISGSTSVSSNKAMYGAGVHVAGTEIEGSKSGTLNFTEGTISSNIATYGGGIYLQSANFTMSGGTISDNQAYCGGGIYTASKTGGTDNGKFEITGGTIGGSGNGNKITGTDTSVSITGAGLALYDSNVDHSIKGCTISSNGKDTDCTTGVNAFGGGIYVGQGVKLSVNTGARITDNGADYGAGIYADKSVNIELSASSAENNVSVDSNIGNVSGGGIYMCDTEDVSKKNTLTVDGYVEIGSNLCETCLSVKPDGSTSLSGSDIFMASSTNIVVLKGQCQVGLIYLDNVQKVTSEGSYVLLNGQAGDPSPQAGFYYSSKNDSGRAFDLFSDASLTIDLSNFTLYNTNYQFDTTAGDGTVVQVTSGS